MTRWKDTAKETINLLRFQVSIVLIEISTRVGEIKRIFLWKRTFLIWKNFDPSINLSIFTLALTLRFFYFGETLRMKAWMSLVVNRTCREPYMSNDSKECSYQVN